MALALNKDQREYMEYINSVPREKRCKCGWYLKGKCLVQACIEAEKGGGHERGK